jgi:hypothetical protein
MVAAKEERGRRRMKELDVLHAITARADNYAISSMQLLRGRLWSLVMGGEYYHAVVLVHSFDYYQLRYHLAQRRPTLIVCYVHDTVVPLPVLSTRMGNFARAYELPEEIEDIRRQRKSRTGARVFMGMYISGIRLAQEMLKEFPDSTRNRYLRKIEDLGRRTRGKPVG